MNSKINQFVNLRSLLRATITLLLLTLAGVLVLLPVQSIGARLEAQPVASESGGSIIYVKAEATGANNGTSWANAYTDLQDALAAATDGDEIWVAASTYKPTDSADRAATFNMPSEVAIYGGFNGTEAIRDQRNWVTNPTVLSGDLNGDDNDNIQPDEPTRADNSYHVVTGSGTASTAILDGFTITAGNANGSNPNHIGGGMYSSNGNPTVSYVTFTGNSASLGGGGMSNSQSSPTLSHVTFTGNSASNHGGGMYNYQSSPTVSHVTFTGNSATNFGGGMSNDQSSPTVSHVTFTGNSAGAGGGMHNYNSNPTVSHVTFTGNSATNDGGGMFNRENSSPTISHVTFTGNSAGDDGGGMYNWENSSPTVSGSIIANNQDSGGTDASAQIYNQDSSSVKVSYSLVQGGWSGTGNIDADPLFVSPIDPDDAPTTAGDFHLQATSPAIDAGNNSAVPPDTVDIDNDGDTTEPVPLELDGNVRFWDVSSVPDTGSGTPPIVDMGPYENGAPLPPTPTPTQTPTNTPTSTQTGTPTPTPTVTLTPTNTLSPTSPTPTNTLVPTLVPTSTPTHTRTPIPSSVASFPFHDDFESGTLGTGWSVSSTEQGVVRVGEEAPVAGAYGIILEDEERDEIDSTAALVLTINLAGQSDVALEFWWREFNDENEAADGLFISDDRGESWYQALSFNNGLSEYRHERINLDAEAAANGLAFNDHFQIKFQFYDNQPVPSDGYAIDEVQLISSVGPTPTATPLIEDEYETDDSCEQAQAIETDGTIQEHTFHDAGDSDWLQIEASEGITLVIEARVPPDSPADVALELYDECSQDGDPFDDQSNTFSADVRLIFRPPSTGSYYLKLSNRDPELYGTDVAYALSVREVSPPAQGALILVAGRLRENDDLQDNIYHVTNAVYNFASTHGCAPTDIYYLAPDTSLDADGDGQSDVDAAASNTNLQQAITNWALDKVGPDRPLTIYMMDHGAGDKLYLDGPNSEWVTTTELDSWLEQLETSVSGLQSNVIIEACESGSFISQPDSVSKADRTVISSTGEWTLAYASQQGAVFSDAFLDALAQGMNLEAAFSEGSWAAKQAHPDQTAWLDDDGNGLYSAADGQLAAQRGFACAVAPPGKLWSPYIMEASVSNSGKLRAKIEDDKGVEFAWAIIYPPSYSQPDSSEEILPESQAVILTEQPDGYYASDYDDFNEPGSYRIIFYALDSDNLTSRPQEVMLERPQSWQLYLPAITR